MKAKDKLDFKLVERGGTFVSNLSIGDADMIAAKIVDLKLTEMFIISNKPKGSFSDMKSLHYLGPKQGFMVFREMLK